MRNKPIRVVVVDDHEIVRIGLQAILGREQDISVVGLAASGEEGLDLVDELRPDVLVVDYSLGAMSGVEVCEKVNADHPQVSVIMLSTFLDDIVIQRSMQAGAKAYVYKDVEGRDLKQMIRAVVKGAVFDPTVAGRINQISHRRLGSPERCLSVRETETLRLVSRGATNVQIAETMKISLNTVKTYLRRAMEKLGCHSRSQAVAAALRRGLL